MLKSLALTSYLIGVWTIFLSATYAQQATGTALIRHASTLNGAVEGSIQVMTAEKVSFNGGASMTGDLLMPGTPSVQMNGQPTYGGTLDGPDIAAPTSHKVTLNGGASLSHVVRRINAVLLPVVTARPLPTGTRSVSLNSSDDSPGDFATLKNLTLNGNAACVSCPRSSCCRVRAMPALHPLRPLESAEPSTWEAIVSRRLSQGPCLPAEVCAGKSGLEPERLARCGTRGGPSQRRLST